MPDETHHCSRCGARFEATELAGLCPRCMAGVFFTPPVERPREPGYPSLPLVGEERRLDDYELITELGRGGMGVVYRARQLSLGREVAVKFLLHGVLAGDAAVARFRAEAEATAGLRHPHIVTVYEVGEDRGRQFFSMELVLGQTLAELVLDGPIPATRAAGYLKRVAEAVQFAHEHGLLHRDLKPSNVMVDEFDEPRVTDFGLAKRAEGSSDLTLSGQVLGTPAYISPEQAGAGRTGTVDARSEVYSLGAILYHLVTGRAPFTGESPSIVIHQVVEVEPIAPRLLNPSLPRDLETICQQCLAKEPARRYATARALAEDLARFLRDEPVHARPAGKVERSLRWCRRRPALAVALGVIAFLIVVVLATSTRSAQRLEGLRREGMTNLYASDMRLAQQAIAESRFGVASDLLERHRPRLGDPDLRGFEWRYFRERCESDETAALDSHKDQVQRAVFSPDGRFVATAAADLQVWEVATRRRIFYRQLGDFVWALAFTHDGGEIIVGAGRGDVHRFEVSTGSELACLTNLPGQPLAFARSTNSPGLRILTRAELVSWDGVSATNQGVLKLPYTASRASVTADGRKAAFLSGPAKVIVWESNSPETFKEFLLPATARALALSPDGNRLAVGDYSGALRTWELTPAGRTNVVAAHRGLIECAAFSPDGARLATAGADQVIRLRSSATGELLGQWQGHRGVVMTLAFSPDGAWLVSGDKLGEVKLWSLRAETGPAEMEPGAQVELSADGGKIVARHTNGTVTVQSTEIAAGPPQELSVPPGCWFIASAHGLAGIDAAGRMHLLKADGTWRELDLPGLAGVRGGVLSPDGRFGGLQFRGGKEAVVWDLAAGREVVRTAKETILLSLTFSGDSRRLACGSASGQTYVWELPSGREVASITAHHNYAYACDLSPDGLRLVTAGFDGLVKLWEVNTGRLLGEYRSTADAYWTVALAPDGRRIAAGTSESSIVLWDVPSRLEVATLQLGEPLHPVEGLLRFAPGGNSLLLAAHSLHRWNAPVPVEH